MSELQLRTLFGTMTDEISGNKEGGQWPDNRM